MTTATRVIDPAELRRSRNIGMVFLLIGAAILLLFARAAEADQTARQGLNPARPTEAMRIADLTLPVLPSLYLMGGMAIVLGVVQLAKGFEQLEGVILGLVAAVLTLAFLIWAARGRSLNLIGIFETTLQRAMPIALAALSGVLCERSGVINIAIEGMMLTAALTSTLFASISGSLWVGVLVSLAFGAALGALLAVMSVRFKVNQIITGTAINILAIGATSYISARFLAVNPALNAPGKFPNAGVPLLSRLPIVGPVFFETNILVYVTLVLLVVVHVMLFYTPWGLRTRAVGEHPRAADTLGIDVYRVRYVNVILGGMVAALSGVFLVLGSVPRFDELMTAGRGFIGLAAMIFGKWTPFGSFGASLIFGFTDTFQARLQILQVPIPSQFMRMAPYIITMIVLAGVVGRAVPPAADGQPYEKQ